MQGQILQQGVKIKGWKMSIFFICLFDTYIYSGGTEHNLVLTPVGAGVETRHS